MTTAGANGEHNTIKASNKIFSIVDNFCRFRRWWNILLAMYMTREKPNRTQLRKVVSQRMMIMTLMNEWEPALGTVSYRNVTWAAIKTSLKLI